jgi:hypothetical protein
MGSSPSVAANLSNDARKGLAILSLSKAEPIAHLADREGVSRQFLYRQKQKAVEALDEAFAARDDDILFHLPATEGWLSQLTLALILVCHSSYRGVYASDACAPNRTASVSIGQGREDAGSLVGA